MENYILNTISEVNLYNYFYLGEEISSDVEIILMELLGFFPDGKPYNEALVDFDTITYNDFRESFIGDEKWRAQLFFTLLCNVYTIGNQIVDNTCKAYGMERKDYSFATINYLLDGICEDVEAFQDLVNDTNFVIKILLDVKDNVNFVLFKEKDGMIDLVELSKLFAENAPGLFEDYFDIQVEKITINDLKSDVQDLAYYDYFCALTKLIEIYEDYNDSINQ